MKHCPNQTTNKDLFKGVCSYNAVFFFNFVFFVVIYRAPVGLVRICRWHKQSDKVSARLPDCQRRSPALERAGEQRSDTSLEQPARPSQEKEDDNP